MSRIESGTHTAQAMQVSVGVTGHDKLASNRPPAARLTQPPGSTTDAATIRVRGDFVQLQNINDRQNRVASQIRSNDRQLQQSDQLLGQMKRTLIRIIKMYPPYPPGEPERVKFLRNFNGLKQQIEQLTLPAERMWTDKTAVVPRVNEAAVPTGSVSDSGPSGVVPGAALTFSIPELPDLADDAHIEFAVHQIDNAQAAIVVKRAAIAEHASDMNQSVGYGAKREELNRTSSEAWDLTVPAEHEAEQKSAEAGSGLDQARGSGMTDTEMQPLLQSLAG